MHNRILAAHKGKGGEPPQKDYQALWSALNDLEALYGLKDKITIESIWGDGVG